MHRLLTCAHHALKHRDYSTAYCHLRKLLQQWRVSRAQKCEAHYLSAYCILSCEQQAQAVLGPDLRMSHDDQLQQAGAHLWAIANETLDTLFTRLPRLTIAQLFAIGLASEKGASAILLNQQWVAQLSAAQLFKIGQISPSVAQIIISNSFLANRISKADYLILTEVSHGRRLNSSRYYSQHQSHAATSY